MLYSFKIPWRVGGCDSAVKQIKDEWVVSLGKNKADSSIASLFRELRVVILELLTLDL